MTKRILDLCGGTGAWSEPYRECWPKYHVTVVDPVGDPSLTHNQGLYPWTVSDFIQMLKSEDRAFPHYHGILIALPCTQFAGSGARWWAKKDPQLLIDAIQLAHACLYLIKRCKPSWWVLENPVGRLARCVPELGNWVETFQPWEYGDPYTKRTCLWGDYTSPKKSPVEPIEGGKIWRMSPGPERAKLRSITPPGFARAFFKANP